MSLGKRMRLLAKVGRAFGADRTGGPAMEFGLVGFYFVLLLFFVIQGGIYFLRETVLDYATETAARAIQINDNPGFAVPAPTSATAFSSLVASNGLGLLDQNNLSVSLQMDAEVKPPPSYASSGPNDYGYQSPTMTPFNFNSSATPTYAFTTVGSCTANYFTNYGAQDGVFDGQTGSGITALSNCSKPAGDTNTSDAVCSSTVANYNGNNQIIGGFADGGSPTESMPYPGVTQTNYTNGTFTCNANQFVLLQVQYKDTTLVPIISNFFGPIVSTIAFKIEPPPT